MSIKCEYKHIADKLDIHISLILKYFKKKQKKNKNYKY